MDYKLKSVPFRTRATPNITPFTYYDGATYLEILERLRKWLTDVLTPAFDDVVEIIDGMIQEALEGVERDLNEMREEVQAALDSVAETDAELRAYVDLVLQQVINNAIEVSDPVIAGVLNDTGSASRQLVSAIANPRVIFVDDYKEPGDTSDTESWQRAVNYAIAMGDEYSFTITGRKDVYRLHERINIDGLKGATLSGGLTTRARMVAQDGAGSINTFRVSMASGTADPMPLAILGDSLSNANVYDEFEANVTDLHVAGNGSTEANLRYGSLPLSVTVEGNAIPTTGSVTITELDPADYWRKTSVQWSIPAELAGVVGTFLFPTGANPLARFVADVAPAAPVSVPAGSPLTVLAGEFSGVGHHDKPLIAWLGRNVTEQLAVFQRDMTQITETAEAATMVVSVTNGSNEPRGTLAYGRVQAMNEWLSSTYGQRYYDLRSWIIHECIYSLGMEPTTADLENMANDCPPPSIMANNDTIHFSTAAYGAIGRELNRQAKVRGLIAATGAPSTERLRFTNFVFDGSATFPADGIFDRRQDNVRADDRLGDAINMDGHLRPDGMDNVVDRIEIDHCDFIGMYSLPVHLKGVSNVDMHDNFIKRSLDTGFTFSRAVKFYNNRVEWSSDNGVSISRGCTEVVISGNNIIGSYYAGIHVGGFAGNAGPTDITITGNTVLQSRQYGISAIDGSRRVVISGNLVDGVLRGAPSSNRDTMGDGAPVVYGTGIVFGGDMTGETTPNANVRVWAEDVTVSGNTVMNCDRMGIIAKGGTRRFTINGNLVVNVGSARSASGGVEIQPNHTYYNIAIGAYYPSRDLIEDGVAFSNSIHDTRSPQLINRGVIGIADVHNIGTRLRNSLRNSAGTSVSAGSNDGTGIFRLNGPSGSTRSFVFESESEGVASLRLSTTNALEFFMYGGDISVPLKFNRSTGAMILDLPTITGVTSNLYVTQNGELRRITG